MTLKKIILLSVYTNLLIFGTRYGYCQNAGLNCFGLVPDVSAILDIDVAGMTPQKGLLIPRVLLTSSTDAVTIPTPANSLLVYNLSTSGFAPPGYYFNQGSAVAPNWVALATSSQIQTIGDVKYGFQPTDHNGWVLLDGRAISGLTSTQQIQASSLGFTTNLPNSTNKVLMKSGALGTTGGTDSINLSQANLPNVNFTGTTDSYSHSHNPYSPFGDYESSISQGYPAFNQHNSFRTSDRPGSPRTSGMISTDTHSHAVTVGSGGSGTAINTTPSYLSVNAFIYLGF